MSMSGDIYGFVRGSVTIAIPIRSADCETWPCTFPYCAAHHPPRHLPIRTTLPSGIVASAADLALALARSVAMLFVVARVESTRAACADNDGAAQRSNVTIPPTMRRIMPV